MTIRGARRARGAAKAAAASGQRYWTAQMVRGVANTPQSCTAVYPPACNPLSLEARRVIESFWIDCTDPLAAVARDAARAIRAARRRAYRLRKRARRST